MRRRAFIAGLASTAAWPIAARAQQQTKPIIGWLDVRPPETLGEAVEGFRQGLAEVGASEGRDVTVEYDVADGYAERFSALAADLVRRRPAAVIAMSSLAALVAKAATLDIPIIFTVGSDPVELGLVTSLNRPGGNLTGLDLLLPEIAEKRLDLLHKAVPAAETIGLLVGPADRLYNQTETRHVQSAARTLGLRLLVFSVTADTEIAPVFATLVGHQAGAIVVGVQVEGGRAKRDLTSLAAHFALPTMFSSSLEARAGALLSYGPEDIETYRQMGTYTGRINHVQSRYGHRIGGLYALT